MCSLDSSRASREDSHSKDSSRRLSSSLEDIQVSSLECSRRTRTSKDGTNLKDKDRLCQAPVTLKVAIRDTILKDTVNSQDMVNKDSLPSAPASTLMDNSLTSNRTLGRTHSILTIRMEIKVIKEIRVEDQVAREDIPVDMVINYEEFLPV